MLVGGSRAPSGICNISDKSVGFSAKENGAPVSLMASETSNLYENLNFGIQNLSSTTFGKRKYVSGLELMSFSKRFCNPCLSSGRKKYMEKYRSHFPFSYGMLRTLKPSKDPQGYFLLLVMNVEDALENLLLIQRFQRKTLIGPSSVDHGQHRPSIVMAILGGSDSSRNRHHLPGLGVDCIDVFRPEIAQRVL
ncbi:hypothetical protein RHGRI_016198 [Rhododendron griersonianum]|uniref:Uncharacterized protein n=1 Tax=Rhododendron griersonianum TaxID=479676 RepID=A0AAV6JRB6_9ERIC|nr:hypothetical protein RHGRI_016198 [Rhododendron griersonianum]